MANKKCRKNGIMKDSVIIQHMLPTKTRREVGEVGGTMSDRERMGRRREEMMWEQRLNSKTNEPDGWRRTDDEKISCEQHRECKMQTQKNKQAERRKEKNK